MISYQNPCRSSTRSTLTLITLLINVRKLFSPRKFRIIEEELCIPVALRYCLFFTVDTDEPFARSESRESQETFIVTTQSGPVWVPVAPSIVKPHPPSTKNSKLILSLWAFFLYHVLFDIIFYLLYSGTKLSSKGDSNRKTVSIKIIPCHMRLFQMPQAQLVRFLYVFTLCCQQFSFCSFSVFVLAIHLIETNSIMSLMWAFRFEPSNAIKISSNSPDIFIPQHHDSIAIEGMHAQITCQLPCTIQIHIFLVRADLNESQLFASARIATEGFNLKTLVKCFSE